MTHHTPADPLRAGGPQFLLARTGRATHLFFQPVRECGAFAGAHVVDLRAHSAQSRLLSGPKSVALAHEHSAKCVLIKLIRPQGREQCIHIAPHF